MSENTIKVGDRVRVMDTPEREGWHKRAKMLDVALVGTVVELGHRLKFTHTATTVEGQQVDGCRVEFDKPVPNYDDSIQPLLKDFWFEPCELDGDNDRVREFTERIKDAWTPKTEEELKLIGNLTPELEVKFRKDISEMKKIASEDTGGDPVGDVKPIGLDAFKSRRTRRCIICGKDWCDCGKGPEHDTSPIE